MNPEPAERDERIAAAVQAACIEAALAGYERAAISGLCHEGAWEAAISAIRMLDLREVLERSRDNTPTD